MILDNTLMVANALAYNGAPTVIDLGALGVGKGEPIRMFIQGSANLATCTGFVVTDGATNAAADALETRVCPVAGNTIEFVLPVDVQRYVKVALTGSLTVGTWSCGIVPQPVDSNW